MSADEAPTINVYSIPTGVPFVDALADGIITRLGRDLETDPAALADVTVLLPTRRACRSLREAFLRRAGDSGVALLPRMLPLGDMDEDELLLAGAFEDELPGPNGGSGLPIGVPRLHRQFLLAKLILARGDTTDSPDQALRLAQELARLLDQFHTERVDPEALKTLRAEGRDLAEHWARTLDFLTIVTEHWPSILAEKGALDPAARRNRVLEAQAEEWARTPPSGPLIAAGSTGTVPATADLLAVIASLPQGAVVLPGLDRHLDDDTWNTLPPSHPQYGLHRLLRRFDIGRREVTDWPCAVAATCPAARLEVLTEALLPADATAAWRDTTPPANKPLAGITRIEADTEQQEATAIALVLREALETEGRTAALVTPNRTLARRVSAELTRFGLAIDDSAGIPLDKTAPGAFLNLTARLAVDGFAPVTLLAVLKHPLAGLGRTPVSLRTVVRELEHRVLRGPRPGSSLADLRQALDEKSRHLIGLIDALDAAARPYVDALSRPKATTAELLRAHIAFAEGLAATDNETGTSRLWAGESGEALAAFAADVADGSDDLGKIAPRAYPALLETMLAGVVMRPRYGTHPRLAVWGPLEARLQHADVMVLGGLNEETWPPATDTGPWLSRPMMDALGLPVPERRIGLAAHDFVQALGAERVVLTRSRRAGGAPTVPSRWLIRLQTLLDGWNHGAAFHPNPDWTRWAAELDEPGSSGWTPTPIDQPRPCPPVAARPTGLSVTQVETWIRDPYSIYARHILNLKPLDPLDQDPGAADRGTIIHDALEDFISAYKDRWPEDPLTELLTFGRRRFQKKAAWPAVRAFWWPRFERIAAWFVAFEESRRAKGIQPLAVEVDGKRAITAPETVFTLRARADRIDRTPDGGLSIVDYKTGRVPSEKQVKAGLAPQLALEAAIAAVGGFNGVPATPVADLTYVKVSGGREPGKETGLSVDPVEAAAAAFEGLERKVRVFASPETPYLSRVRAERDAWTGDYDHLARVKEWSAGGGDGE